MSSHNDSTNLLPPLDLSWAAKLPMRCMVAGGVVCAIGLVMGIIQALSNKNGLAPALSEFGFSWLLAFAFFLSIALGSLFLVMVHHLTDAGWSVPIRRVCEHLASLLFPWLAVLFVPVLLLGKYVYQWMAVPSNNLIAAKFPVFTLPGIWLTSAAIFAVWWLLSSGLVYWSLRQDVTGAVECTRKLRFYSGWGIVAYAITLTCASIFWIKAVQYQWYSCIYGVYFFASVAWVTLATIYVLTVLLQRQRVLDRVLKDNQFYFIGVLFFGFTVFQAYTEFAQYFVVWNANMPIETFYYLIRENGTWWWLSMILIFGHFLVPFFIMLPLSVKTNFKVFVPVCVSAWFLHVADLAYNIFPALHPDGYHFGWFWLPIGCLLLQGGFLAKIFVAKFQSHPPYPQKDPHVLQAMGIHFYEQEMESAPGRLTDAANTPGGNR